LPPVATAVLRCCNSRVAPLQQPCCVVATRQLHPYNTQILQLSVGVAPLQQPCCAVATAVLHRCNNRVALLQQPCCAVATAVLRVATVATDLL